jgi:hypothetical protein
MTSKKLTCPRKDINFNYLKGLLKNMASGNKPPEAPAERKDHHQIPLNKPAHCGAGDRS